jgi:hypothetical protein
MVLIRRLLVLIAIALATPAAAADVVFPPGSRLGIAPPPGTAPSTHFFGFEDRNKGVAIVLIGLPAEAYADIEKSLTAEGLKQQGVALEKLDSFELPVGKSILISGRQKAEGVEFRKWMLIAAAKDMTVLITVQVPVAAAADYSDETIRAALKTATVRDSVPIDEQLTLLPFKVAELAQFQIGGIIPGRALMLRDPLETNPRDGFGSRPNMIIAVTAGGPAMAAERDAFARDAFVSIPNLKEVRLTSAEPLRIGGQAGHQIIASAKDSATGADITVVQWLRFGSGAYMQMVGVASVGAWPEAYPRFRSVRDGIDPR